MNLSSLKSNKYLIILSVIFLISAISDVIWLYYENTPQGADESRHLISSLQYYHILTNNFNIKDLINVDNYYPPFYHFSTVLSYYLFGTSDDSAIYINILYFGILLFSTFGIGKLLYNEQVGLLSAVFVSLFPSIIGMQRFYLIELALVSTVTLSIYLLLKTDHFKNRKQSILFGLSFAVSILTKWTAVFFIIPPLLIILYEIYKKQPNKCKYCGVPTTQEFCSKNHAHQFKKNPPHTPTPTTNLSISLFITSILSAIWYIPHFKEVYDTIVWGNQYWGTTEGDPEVFTIQSITHYIFALNWQISFVFMIVFVIGLIYMIRSKPNYLLLSWIVVPYIVMTLMRNKNDRYTFPSIVAVAIIGALWLTTIKKPILPYTVVGIGIIQIIMLANGLDMYSPQVYGTRPPMTEDWKLNDAIDTITKDIPTNPRFQQPRYVNVGILPDLVLINQYTVQYYSLTKKAPFQVIGIPWFENLQPFQQNINKFDYIIVKTGENAGPSRQKLVDSMYEFFYTQSQYKPISSLSLPDKSELIIYRNSP